MLVQINDPVIVGPSNSFNEIPVLPDDGSWAGPRTAHGGILYSYDDGNPERIIVDDAIVPIPQRLNVGDHFAGSVIGVVDYNFGLFMVELTQSPTVVSGGLAKETTASHDRSSVRKAARSSPFRGARSRRRCSTGSSPPPRPNPNPCVSCSRPTLRTRSYSYSAGSRKRWSTA